MKHENTKTQDLSPDLKHENTKTQGRRLAVKHENTKIPQNFLIRPLCGHQNIAALAAPHISLSLSLVPLSALCTLICLCLLLHVAHICLSVTSCVRCQSRLWQHVLVSGVEKLELEKDKHQVRQMISENSSDLGHFVFECLKKSKHHEHCRVLPLSLPHQTTTKYCSS